MNSGAGGCGGPTEEWIREKVYKPRLKKIWKSYRHVTYYKMCRAWNRDFMAFYRWSLENGYRPGLALCTIDLKKGYSPRNCYWGPQLVLDPNGPFLPYGAGGGG